MAKLYRMIYLSAVLLAGALLAPPLRAEVEYAVPSAMASKGLLLDVARLDMGGRERLLAVGEFGHIIYSDDQGASWQQAERVPTRVTLTAVYFLNPQLGFAVGHDAMILRSEDGGVNWQLQYSDPKAESPLFGVYFRDAQNGVAVGAFSLVLETKDGGTTWTPRPLAKTAADDFHLNGIFADSKGDIYIPAEFGKVYKSTDGGASFATLTTPYGGSFWGGMTLANGELLIWGMRGNVYRSADGGTSWQRAKTATDRSISGGAQLADGRIVLTGLSGLVLESKDGGKNFTETVRPDRFSFSALAEADIGAVVLFGPQGVTRHMLAK